MTLHKDVKSPTYSKASYQGVAAEEIELPDSIASTHFHNQISQPQISLHFNEVDRKQRSFWRRTFEEIKNAPWRWIFRRFFSHILPLLIICGLSVFLAKLSDKYFFAIRDDPVCQLNGSFSITNGGYSPWTRDAVFAINIRFGTYSFSTAKFIDIVWDIVSLRPDMTLNTNLMPFRSSAEVVRLCLLSSRTRLSPNSCPTKWKSRMFLMRPSRL